MSQFLRLAGVLALGLGAALSPAFGQTAEPAAKSAVRLPAATVVKAAPRQMQQTVPINGSLVPRQTVVVTPQVSGYQIIAVEADVGDKVEKGQVLVRLDRAPLQASLDQAEAQVAAAKAAVSQAESQIGGQQATADQAETALSRAKQLLKGGAGTQATLDQAQASYTTAAASLQAAKDALVNAKAQVEQAEAKREDTALQLSRTEVTSPVAGIVSERNADLGQMTGATGGSATPLFSIIRDGDVEFDGHIIETAIPQVKAGQDAAIYPAGFDARHGKVRLVSPSVDPKTRLGSVKITIDQDDGLPIGIFGRAVVVVANRTGITVPLSAVIPGINQSTVQVVDAEGRIHVKPVHTGIVDGNYIEVLDGLREGDTVVAKSGPFFRDGMTINPVPVQEKGPGSKGVAEAAAKPAAAPAAGTAAAAEAGTGRDSGAATEHAEADKR